MSKEAFAGVYANMDFPPYKFREYPKLLGYKTGTKEPIIAHSQSQEIEFLTRDDVTLQETKTKEAENTVLLAKLAEQDAELKAMKERLAEYTNTKSSQTPAMPQSTIPEADLLSNIRTRPKA